MHVDGGGSKEGSKHRIGMASVKGACLVHHSMLGTQHLRWDGPYRRSVEHGTQHTAHGTRHTAHGMVIWWQRLIMVS